MQNEGTAAAVGERPAAGHVTPRAKRPHLSGPYSQGGRVGQDFFLQTVSVQRLTQLLYRVTLRPKSIGGDRLAGRLSSTLRNCNGAVNAPLNRHRLVLADP